MKPSKDQISINEIVDSFAERLERGERPSIESYKERYPELAEEIESVLPTLLMLDDIDSKPPVPKLAVDDSIPSCLGEYQIIKEVGRGGMGIVFEAQHTTMRRRVALKVLPKSSTEKPNHLSRFLTEARSAGQTSSTPTSFPFLISVKIKGCITTQCNSSTGTISMGLSMIFDG